MATALWRPGRRLFTVAAALMVVTAVAHTLGNLAPDQEDASLQLILTDMSSHRFPLGLGMTPSMLDIYRTLVFTMSITLAALGSLNLTIAASREVTDGLVGRLTWVNIAWVGAFLMLALAYRIPPALISAVVIEAVLFASQFARAGR
jgi:hypothetical protein